MSEPAKPVTLVAPDGQRYDAPTPDAVARLKAKGFRDLNEAELKDIELQHKYGEGVLPPIGAALAEGANTLTFGASSAALGAISPDVREGLNELHERNPTASTVGGVAALAVPVLGELGAASTATKVAKGAGTAITGVSKAAQAVGSTVAKGAEALGLKGSAKVLGGAAQAATEGAAFQVGGNVADVARRDADYDAETLFAHVGESAALGAGIGAALPAASKVVKWSADKAIGGLETAMQGLRAAGFGVAHAGVDAVEAGATALGRNADAIGEGIASGVRGAADVLDKGASAVVRNADNIGGAVEGLGQRIANASDEHLLPRIRKGLIEETGRPDVINEVFANTAEARALRNGEAAQTITKTRELQGEALAKALNPVWEQSLGHEPMLSELVIGLKKDLQSASLARNPIEQAAHNAVASNINAEAKKTLAEFEKYSGVAHTAFTDHLAEFRKAATAGEPDSLYMALDRLKQQVGELGGFEKGAKMSASGSAYAEAAAQKFYGVLKDTLEDTSIWGKTGLLQQQTNAAVRRSIDSFNKFAKFFGVAPVKGSKVAVLDGGKIQKWAAEMTGTKGQLRNKVIEDLVDSQKEAIALAEKLRVATQAEARDTLASKTATEQAKARASAVEDSPDGIANILGRHTKAINNVDRASAAAFKSLDRGEVLQETQNSILSRNGAGVNPLPVDMLKGIGGGAVVGNFIGGVPGALLGGGVMSVFQKYGALTTNPKSAIEFLNKVDRLRAADKERISSWIKSTLGESDTKGARGLLKNGAEKIDGKKIGAAIRKGADAVQPVVDSARAGIESANMSTAKQLLAARRAAEGGVERAAGRFDAATPGLMARILPAVSYADVKNSKPDEWWARTQKSIVSGLANSNALQADIEKDTAGIAEDFPDLAAAIGKQKLAVFGYLADRMPRNPRPLMVGARQWKPTPLEMKNFRDLVLVATKPDALLPLITTGGATRAQVQAVKDLYPKRFEDMRKTIVDSVMSAASEGKPVPYKARVHIGHLIGTPLDASQEPGFSRWLQGSSQAPPPDAEPQDSGRAANVKLGANDLKPLSMRVDQRMNT